MGMDDFAQKLAGEIVYVQLPNEGKKLKKGKKLAKVESGKWLGKVLSPVNGELIAVNEDLELKPELINQDCYGAGWMYRLKADDLERAGRPAQGRGGGGALGQRRDRQARPRGISGERTLDNRLYSKGQLLSMEACTGCAACAEACPAVNASGDGELSGLYRLDWRRRAGKAGAGWLRRLFGGKPPTDEQWKAFSDTVFRCTLCGNCAEVCPAGIGLKDLWLSLQTRAGGARSLSSQGGPDPRQPDREP